MTQTARRADPAPPHAGDAVVGHTARVWAWLCGVVAGLTGMAVADLLAYLVAPAGAPLPAVGSMIIELLPAGLVNWGKETLGTADKPVLLVIVGPGCSRCAVWPVGSSCVDRTEVGSSSPRSPPWVCWPCSPEVRPVCARSPRLSWACWRATWCCAC